VRSAAGGGDGRVRWLNPKELAAWIELRRLLLVLPTALDAQMLRQAGMSFFEYQIMSSLSEKADRTQRMSELAEATSSSLSRLSHAVTRLEDKGFVIRRRCAGVGRSSVAILTYKGHRKLVAVAPGHVESVRSLVMSGLNQDQIDSLATIARRIAEQLAGDDVGTDGA
jgi:DNA-binding MarR family transcriptional regulator